MQYLQGILCLELEVSNVDGFRHVLHLLDLGIFKLDMVRKEGEYVPKWTCPGILQLFSSKIFCTPEALVNPADDRSAFLIGST